MSVSAFKMRTSFKGSLSIFQSVSHHEYAYKENQTFHGHRDNLASWKKQICHTSHTEQLDLISQGVWRSASISYSFLNTVNIALNHTAIRYTCLHDYHILSCISYINGKTICILVAVQSLWTY